KALLASRPSLENRLQVLPTIASIAENTFEKKEISAAERARKHKKLYTKEPILEVENLKKYYVSNAGLFSKKEEVKAVNDVSFAVFEGETLGLVGESGCGKSTLGKTILQLEEPTGGRIKFYGKELTTLSSTEIRRLRKEIQIIFQDPYASLN